jgi:hypothetical protein
MQLKFNRLGTIGWNAEKIIKYIPFPMFKWFLGCAFFYGPHYMHEEET